MWTSDIGGVGAQLCDRSCDRSRAYVITIAFPLGRKFCWAYIDGGAYECIDRKKLLNLNRSDGGKPSSHLNKKSPNLNGNNWGKLKICLLVLLASEHSLMVRNLWWEIVEEWVEKNLFWGLGFRRENLTMVGNRVQLLLRCLLVSLVFVDRSCFFFVVIDFRGFFEGLKNLVISRWCLLAERLPLASLGIFCDRYWAISRGVKLLLIVPRYSSFLNNASKRLDSRRLIDSLSTLWRISRCCRLLNLVLFAIIVTIKFEFECYFIYSPLFSSVLLQY